MKMNASRKQKIRKEKNTRDGTADTKTINENKLIRRIAKPANIPNVPTFRPSVNHLLISFAFHHIK